MSLLNRLLLFIFVTLLILVIGEVFFYSLVVKNKSTTAKKIPDEAIYSLVNQIEASGRKTRFRSFANINTIINKGGISSALISTEYKGYVKGVVFDKNIKCPKCSNYYPRVKIAIQGSRSENPFYFYFDDRELKNTSVKKVIGQQEENYSLQKIKAGDLITVKEIADVINIKPLSYEIKVIAN